MKKPQVRSESAEALAEKDFVRHFLWDKPKKRLKSAVAELEWLMNDVENRHSDSIEQKKRMETPHFSVGGRHEPANKRS